HAVDREARPARGRRVSVPAVRAAAPAARPQAAQRHPPLAGVRLRPAPRAPSRAAPPREGGDAVGLSEEPEASARRPGYSFHDMTNRSIFYGWWVVAAFSVTTFMSTGVRHAVGPFLKPIVADLGLDRASFSAVIALSLFLYGVFMPIAGMALDRFSVRVVTSVGTVLLVISLVLTAFVRNFWEFAAVYGVLVPLGLAGTGPVIASGVVARWFNKRRGTALSVLGSASMT